MNYQTLALQVFDIEANAVLGLKNRLTNNFDSAIKSILTSQGRVIICGMGKSGIIGKKIAATMASTGTPSFFMHPGEAYHGDLGMVSPDDVFIAISNSGETDEVVKLIPFLKDNGNVLIAMTGNPKSTLALAANYHLDVGVEQEACPLQLAPTASTTATLAMGDALAVTLMKARDFKPENFARFHPGGSLGRRLLSRVENEMSTENLPILNATASMADVITTMSKSGLGLAIVMANDVAHVITDGDLRRAIERYQAELFSKCANDLMVANPVTVKVGTRVEDALQLMDTKGINSVLVSDGQNVVGVFKK
ncbi:KpsF/GutQ family sugar-phosphate isomerase [Thalassolituus oleivorans]|uniref:Arabinose 5-phosphate isomerase n=1 Tax=Thalassolituus oleivorans MIL-1 TaxID=1298593 RepID=M5DU78_9GAMM|nr:KpsF/GutQ family sugar-phosphate isomerase [Thalassolituus oleivorans]CCU72962.1 carbohydrate isomerase, KpsF/GutQ family protein [Thalassolituus oleivorans MIL-1]